MSENNKKVTRTEIVREVKDEQNVTQKEKNMRNEEISNLLRRSFRVRARIGAKNEAKVTAVLDDAAAELSTLGADDNEIVQHLRDVYQDRYALDVTSVMYYCYRLVGEMKEARRLADTEEIKVTDAVEHGVEADSPDAVEHGVETDSPDAGNFIELFRRMQAGDNVAGQELIVIIQQCLDKTTATSAN